VAQFLASLQEENCMVVRRPWLVVAALLVPAVVGAHDHKWDARFGASVIKFHGKEAGSGVARALSTSTNAQAAPVDLVASGFRGSIAKTWKDHEWFSLVLDASLHYHDDPVGGKDVWDWLVMIGPRVTLLHGKHIPQLQVLPLAPTRTVNGAQFGLPEGMKWGLAVGVMYDFIPAKSSAGKVAWRLQYDRLILHSGQKDQDRYSIGVVYRILNK
jgi:hypothetical protein